MYWWVLSGHSTSHEDAVRSAPFAVVVFRIASARTLTSSESETNLSAGQRRRCYATANS